MNQLTRSRILFTILFLCCVYGVRGESVILHLRNGDRLTGTLISEDTNRVVIGTPWQKELGVPKSEITSREVVPAPKAPPLAGATSAPAPATVVTAKPTPPIVPKPPKRWAVDLQFGLDVQESTKDRTLYYTRDKLTYGRALAQERDRFRSILDYSYSYGRTEGIRSTDQMNGSSKVDFDLGKRMFLYNLGGAGYDKIRHIDLQFEEGPGVGVHLLTRTNFVLNSEFGMNYQSQDFSDHTEARNVYFRVAEDLSWKLSKKVDLVQKFEFFPQADTFSKFRMRFDSTVHYSLLQNLSINLTVADFYDSRPAANVDPNDLQIRSSIGVRF